MSWLAADPRLCPVKGHYDCIFCGHWCWPRNRYKIEHPAFETFSAHAECLNAHPTHEEIRAAALSATHDIVLGRRLPIPLIGVA